MPKNVIIYMPRVSEDFVQWAATEGKGVLSSPVQEGSLSEAAASVAGGRCTLILPADDVLLVQCTIPGNSLARARQAAPYALEEQVADDVDDLHFALGSKDKDDQYPVVVIDRATMEHITGRCEAAGLRPLEIVPETLAIPRAGASGSDVPELGSALLDGQRVVLRLGDYEGFATDTEMAAMMVEGAMAARQDSDTESPSRIVAFHVDGAVAMDLPAAVDVEYHYCDHRLELYASALDNTPGINLLQGDYSLRQGLDKTWKPWRATAMLAASLLLVLLGSRYLDVRALSNQQAALDTQIGQAFAEALPGTRMQRPRRQVQSALDNIGVAGNDGFTSRLAQIAASLSTQPQTQLRTIGYRQGRFDLDLETDAVPTLDALASELSRRGTLRLSVQSANRENGKVRGRVRVE